MQAVIQDRYGGPHVVRLGELPEPVPADDEVLLRVRAASLNGSDRENLAGHPAYARWANGLRRPRNPVPSPLDACTFWLLMLYLRKCASVKL